MCVGSPSHSACHIGITAYRNKEGVLNVLTAGGIVMIVYKIKCLF